MSRFGLDDIQAQAILDMRLKALQGLDREKLEAEYKELEEKIAYFNQLLSSDELLRKVLKEELQPSPTNSAMTGSRRSRMWRMRSTSRT